jgi:hypothetical protein
MPAFAGVPAAAVCACPHQWYGNIISIKSSFCHFDDVLPAKVRVMLQLPTGLHVYSSALHLAAADARAIGSSPTRILQ